jgi:hypothetical protein
VVVLLGKCADVVADPRVAKRAVRAFLEPEARHAGTDATDCGLSRHPIEEQRWPTVVEYCSFDWMKRNATKSVRSAGPSGTPVRKCS